MGACGSKAETARGIESGDGRGKVGIPAGAFPVHLTTFEAPVLSVTGCTRLRQRASQRSPRSAERLIPLQLGAVQTVAKER